MRYLEAHHEGAWSPLASVEQASPFHPDINVVQAEVLPLGLPSSYKLTKLGHILPCGDAVLLILCLLSLVNLWGQSTLLQPSAGCHHGKPGKIRASLSNRQSHLRHMQEACTLTRPEFESHFSWLFSKSIPASSIRLASSGVRGSASYTPQSFAGSNDLGSAGASGAATAITRTPDRAVRRFRVREPLRPATDELPGSVGAKLCILIDL